MLRLIAVVIVALSFAVSCKDKTITTKKNKDDKKKSETALPTNQQIISNFETERGFLDPSKLSAPKELTPIDKSKIDEFVGEVGFGQIPFFTNPVYGTKLRKWDLANLDQCFREWMRNVIVRAQKDKLEIVYEHNEQYETCLRKIYERNKSLYPTGIPDLEETFETPIDCKQNVRTVHNWFSVGGRTQLMIFSKDIDLSKYDKKSLAEYAFEPVSIFDPKPAKIEIFVNVMTRRKSLYCDADGYKTVYSSVDIRAFSMGDGAPCVVDPVKENTITNQFLITACQYRKIELVEGIVQSERSDNKDFAVLAGQYFTAVDFANVVGERGRSAPLAGDASFQINDWGGSIKFDRLMLPKWTLQFKEDTVDGVIDVDKQ